MKSKDDIGKKPSLFSRFLNTIEKVGNKLPDPVTIFIILSALVIVVSAIVAKCGVVAVHPSTGKEILPVNLLSVSGFQKFLSSVVTNFQGFAPLGLVLVVMLGAGVAEKTGLMAVMMKAGVKKIPRQLVTVVIIFIGILGNAAGDAGFVVLPPLAAIVFMGIGRHPLLGMFTGFAGLAAGFSANLMVNMLDILVASFTEPAARLVAPNYVSNPAMNLYFLIASAVVLVIAGTFVCEKIIAPRFGKYEGSELSDAVEEISATDKKGLKAAGLSLLIIIGIIVALSIGPNAFMKDPETGSLFSNNSTMMKGLVAIITIVFFVPGYVFGKVTGKIKNDRDTVAILNTSMSDMGSYIVLAFVAGQFLFLFNTSNLGTILSIKGAQGLQSIGFTGAGLIVVFVLFAGFINLFVGSASAKWAIMAPVFVPMFLLLGYDPALTQVAYRIGDSITNPLSPLFPYFPVLLGFAKKYDKKIGMGTIISNMLPFSLVFALVWIVLLLVFIIFKIPLGIGGGIYMHI